MNCREFERLLDAYLDDELHGSLRLEFDAHRIKCGHCQQKVAMMEAVGSTLRSDSDIPSLSDDFTQKLMVRIERLPKKRRLLRFPAKVTIAAGMVLQAAAVVLIAVLVQTSNKTDTTRVDSIVPQPQPTPVAVVEQPTPPDPKPEVAAPETLVASARETREPQPAHKTSETLDLAAAYEAFYSVLSEKTKGRYGNDIALAIEQIPVSDDVAGLRDDTSSIDILDFFGLGSKTKTPKNVTLDENVSDI